MSRDCKRERERDQAKPRSRMCMNMCGAQIFKILKGGLWYFGGGRIHHSPRHGAVRDTGEPWPPVRAWRINKPPSGDISDLTNAEHDAEELPGRARSSSEG